MKARSRHFADDSLDNIPTQQYQSFILILIVKPPVLPLADLDPRFLNP